MVEAAEPHADDEQHRQVQPRGDVEHVVPRVERHQRAARAFDDQRVAIARVSRRPAAAMIASSIARRPLRAARCGATGGANAYGLRSAMRRVDVPRQLRARRRRRSCPAPVRMPAATGFMPTARTPRAASARNSAVATCGLADAGIGAGDEEPAHRASRQPRPAAAAGRSHALPASAAARLSTRGRRPLRTSPGCGRRRRSASSAAASACEARAAHQPARPAARRLVAPIAFSSAQQRARRLDRSA